MKKWLSHHAQSLWLALKRLLQNPFASLLNISVIGIALSLPSGLYALLTNLESLSRQVSGEPQISLFVSMQATPEEVAQKALTLKLKAATIKKIPSRKPKKIKRLAPMPEPKSTKKVKRLPPEKEIHIGPTTFGPQPPIDGYGNPNSAAGRGGREVSIIYTPMGGSPGYRFGKKGRG